jgi:uncharacterized protein (TIGR02001 family)
MRRRAFITHPTKLKARNQPVGPGARHSTEGFERTKLLFRETSRCWKGSGNMRSDPGSDRKVPSVAGITAAALLLLSAPAGPARAQGGVDLGARGTLVPERSTRAEPAQEGSENAIEFSGRAGLATDYIYRGVTLSARQPAIGAAFEAALKIFYAGVTFASVKLPTQPAGEISTTAGVRPQLGNITFDLSATRYYYPGETVSPGEFAGIDYWEAVARADTTLGEVLRVAAGFAYSPNVSNTGSWSKYAAFGLGLDMPSSALPRGVSVSLSAGAGHSWFGNQSAALGGFPLPAYLNWNAGLTVSRGPFNLDLRYHDTNLSREDCFVFTGDPGATPGGRPNPITNPEGLVSRWCSAAVVAKFWFALN